MDSFHNRIWSDVEELRAACGNEPPLDRVCPQRFTAAVSPDVAASMEGRCVDDDLLLSAIDLWRPFADQLIIEGAGGIFCPLSDQSTVMDFAIHLNAPVIVVAANRLGVINHTRLTVDSLQSRGLNVTAIVLNETTTDPTTDLDPSKTTNARQLGKWIPDVPLLHCQFGANALTVLTPQHQCLDILPFSEPQI